VSESANHSIREAMRYNSTNMGELGKYIRLEYVEQVLDRYIIVGKNADAELELGRIQEIRNALMDVRTESDRDVLTTIYRIVNP
jgi:hypothetical protein